MKSLLPILALLVSTSTFAAPWTLVPIAGKDATVGYIYHTDATGTRTDGKPVKEFTSLRFICSLKGGDPVISVFWNGASNYGSQMMVHVQSAKQNESLMWDTDNNLVYRTVQESGSIIQILKNNKLVKFQWAVGNTQYITSFNSDGLDLTDFDAKCKH